MELPDDVLAIVRQYSKPCFTHYNDTCTEHEWPLLKEHLSMSAEKVVSFVNIWPPLSPKKKRTPHLNITILPSSLTYGTKYGTKDRILSVEKYRIERTESP